METSKRIRFVDYHWDLEPNGDIIFDKDLTVESMKMWEGKTFEVEILSDGRIKLKKVENWDMMPDPNDIDWEKHFAEGGTIHIPNWNNYENKESK